MIVFWIGIINAAIGLLIVIKRLYDQQMYPGFWRTIKCLFFSFAPILLSCYLMHISVLDEFGPIPIEISGAFLCVVLAGLGIAAGVLEAREKK